jgi:hypothetical protein
MPDSRVMSEFALALVAAGILAALFAVLLRQAALLESVCVQVRELGRGQQALYRRIKSSGRPCPDTQAAPAAGIDSSHCIAIMTGLEVARMRRRVAQVPAGEPARAIERSLERIERRLADQGYSVREFDGQRYVDGMTVPVSSYTVDPLLAPGDQVVSRTIRPAVTYRGVIIEPGLVEVSVGRSAAREQIKPQREEAVYGPAHD